MAHQSLRNFAPVPTTLLMTSTRWHRQPASYSNMITQIITGFVLGSVANTAAIVRNSKSGEEISRLIPLEPLPVKSEYELWSNLNNTINFMAQ